MFVYLVKDAKKRQFKIGKSRDINYRLAQLGLPEDFDVAASHCIKLPSDADAYRIESALHKLYHPWQVEIDVNNRYDGDTEQFYVECYDHVIEFLVKHPEFIYGAAPQPIPSPAKPPAKKTREQQLQARQEREREERAVAGLGVDVSMVVFECAVTQLMELGLDVFELCEQTKVFLQIESSDQEKFDRAAGLVAQLHMPVKFYYPNGGWQCTRLVGTTQTRRDAKAGRYKMSADISVPVTDQNKDELNQDYVRTIDMIPKSQVPREPVEIDLDALFGGDDGDGYIPVPM